MSADGRGREGGEGGGGRGGGLRSFYFINC